MTSPDDGAPAAVRMPSLLRSLLSEHLDPGYAAAADRRRLTGRVRRPAVERLWQALAALLVAVVFAAAAAQARSTAPGVSAARDVLAESVADTQARVEQLTDERATLAAETDRVQRRELADDATGRALLAGLDDLALSGATTPVSGPGLSLVVTDPGAGPDLTDVAGERIAGRRQVILDRDLQLVVNALWASGAEAISVGGVRMGPGVTIRQAGGSILVDNQPIASPYAVLAAGPPESMAQTFDSSRGLQRLRLLEAAYGAGVRVSVADSLSLPAAPARGVTFARRAGS